MAKVQFVNQLLEQLSVFGRFDRVDTGADDRHARFGQTTSEVQRRLTTELNDHAIGLDGVADIQHIFDRQRFKEQHVRGVVVGADRFRVAVDHHAFDADLAKCEAGVTATVVEFDSLADAVRTATKNDDAFLVTLGRQFILDFIGAVVIRRVGLEFRCAGIDAFEDGSNSQFQTPCPDLRFRRRSDLGNLTIGEPVSLGLIHVILGHCVERTDFNQSIFFFDDLCQVIEEPNINVGQSEDFIDGHARLQGVANVEDSFRTRCAQLRPDFIRVWLCSAPQASRLSLPSPNAPTSSPRIAF